MSLLKCLPVDVVPVNCNDEENLQNIIKELNITTPTVPCVIYWREDEEKFLDAGGVEQIVPPHWAFYVFEDETRQWNWSETHY